MKRKFTLTFLTILIVFSVKAQIADGSIAKDFTFTDMNGKSHNLYTYLNEGKFVVFEVFATWCGPCWNYHNSHALKNFYNKYGPDGTDQSFADQIC